MIKLLKFTIASIILGIVSVLIFDAGYLLTILVTGNIVYAVNAGLAANGFIIFGVVIDAFINSTKYNKKNESESDLIPKGFKPVVMPEDAKNDLNRRQDVENSIQVENTPDKEKLARIKDLAEFSQNSIQECTQ